MSKKLKRDPKNVLPIILEGPTSKLRLNIIEPGPLVTPSIDRISAAAGPIKNTIPIITSVNRMLIPYFFNAPLLDIL